MSSAISRTLPVLPWSTAFAGCAAPANLAVRYIFSELETGRTPGRESVIQLLVTNQYTEVIAAKATQLVAERLAEYAESISQVHRMESNVHIAAALLLIQGQITQVVASLRSADGTRIFAN